MSVFGNFPPLKLRHWSTATCGLSHEQKGLLVDFAEWVYVKRGDPNDLEAFRKARRVDPRKFSRLWTEDVRIAYSKVSSVRRPLDTLERLEIYDRDGGACRYCGEQLSPSGYHVDHIHPVSRGGASHAANLATACPTCNLKKGARHV